MHTTCGYGLVLKPFQIIFYPPGGGRFAKMMAGNYMGDFYWFVFVFDENQTVQFENPAVQTYRRLRRIGQPEQNFRGNVV